MSDKPMEVVTALFRKDNRFLIGLRDFNHPAPDIFEFPGGKIDPGETPEQALKREMKEELGIDVEVGELISLNDVEHMGKNFKVYLYECQVIGGKFKLTAHIEVVYRTLDEILKLNNVMPSFRSLIPFLKEKYALR